MKNKKSELGFGSLIKSLRLKKEATLKEVADFIGYSPIHISDVENERRSPFSEEAIKKIAKFYSYNVDELIDLARLSRKKLELGIENLRQNQKELALNLARRWENMDDNTINKINQFLGEKGEECK